MDAFSLGAVWRELRVCEYSPQVWRKKLIRPTTRCESQSASRCFAVGESNYSDVVGESHRTVLCINIYLYILI